jgi:hypothetical protein
VDVTLREGDLRPHHSRCGAAYDFEFRLTQEALNTACFAPPHYRPALGLSKLITPDMKLRDYRAAMNSLHIIQAQCHPG